jgi:hypothetical protein
VFVVLTAASGARPQHGTHAGEQRLRPERLAG